jgi:hypothetical protein
MPYVPKPMERISEVSGTAIVEHKPTGLPVRAHAASSRVQAAGSCATAAQSCCASAALRLHSRARASGADALRGAGAHGRPREGPGGEAEVHPGARADAHIERVRQARPRPRLFASASGARRSTLTPHAARSTAGSGSGDFHQYRMVRAPRTACAQACVWRVEALGLNLERRCSRLARPSRCVQSRRREQFRLERMDQEALEADAQRTFEARRKARACCCFRCC